MGGYVSQPLDKPGKEQGQEKLGVFQYGISYSPAINELYRYIPVP